MPLAKLAIKQPVFITMVLLAVTLVGVLSYFRMGVELYPDMSNPVVMVGVSFPGASPRMSKPRLPSPSSRPFPLSAVLTACPPPPARAAPT